MKLSDVLKPSSVAEIHLVDGTTLSINIPGGAPSQLLVVDDAGQRLAFIILVTQGRKKGSKAHQFVPYLAIRDVIVYE